MICLWYQGTHTWGYIDFAECGAWDVHIEKVLDSGRKKVNQLHSVICNKSINLSAHTLFLLAVGS